MATIRRSIKTSADTSRELREELNAALLHPREIFGYGHYGERWPRLNTMSGGLQPKTLGVLAARPKVGKSMLAAGWVPGIAEQAMMEGMVVRVVTLEMTRKSYQRRMAAIMAEIADPMNIRRGTITQEEVKRYQRALNWLESLPIEYLSNEVDLTEEEAMLVGNSPVTFDELNRFVRGDGDTYWWLLDHIGLVADLDSNGDITRSIYNLANKLVTLAHTSAAGLVITHLTRTSAGQMPTIESIAGSDQVGRNADTIMLLSRPFRDAANLTDDEIELLKDGEPALLQYISRDEGTGIDVLWWDKALAAFGEMEVPDGTPIPMPASKKKK